MRGHSPLRRWTATRRCALYGVHEQYSHTQCMLTCNLSMVQPQTSRLITMQFTASDRQRPSGASLMGSFSKEQLKDDSDVNPHM